MRPNSFDRVEEAAKKILRDVTSLWVETDHALSQKAKEGLLHYLFQLVVREPPVVPLCKAKKQGPGYFIESSRTIGVFSLKPLEQEGKLKTRNPPIEEGEWKLLRG